MPTFYKSLWLALSLILILFSAIPTTQAGLTGPENPIRDMEIVTEVYSGDPAQRYLAQAHAAAPLYDQKTNVAPLNLDTYDVLAYYSYAELNWDVYVMSLLTEGTRRLTSLSSIEAYPTVSADTRYVAFASNQSGNFELYMVDRYAPAAMTQLTYNTADDLRPVWSRTSNKIAFQSNRSGNSDIFVMNADGSGTQQATSNLNFDGYPSWSPDGTQLVFSSLQNRVYDLWVVNADGSNLRRLTSGANALSPAWSPLGDKIAYSADSDGDGWLELWWMNADGSGRTLLIRAGAQTDAWLPTWSPHGDKLGFIVTNWVYYYGRWYWTSSYALSWVLGSSSATTLLEDDRVWGIDWWSADMTPPGPCTVTLTPYQRADIFMPIWSAADIGIAGISFYEAQIRWPGGTWNTFIEPYGDTKKSFQGLEGEVLEFRCRAGDAAGNIAAWEINPIASTTIDTLPPQPHTVVPRCVRASTPAVVQWGAEEYVSGITVYDVWRKQAGDTWELWYDNTTITHTTFSGAAGQTYHLRSRARDGVGHIAPWEPGPQASVSFYTHLISGTVTDNRGNPLKTALIQLHPDVLYTGMLAAGEYQACLSDPGYYTLTVASAGHGALPPTHLAVSEDIRYALVLPPLGNRVNDGGFESGTLSEWTLSGNGLHTDTQRTYAGNYALALVATTPDTHTAEQSIYVDPSLHNPTLSLLYALPADMEVGVFQIYLIEESLSGTILISRTIPVFETAAATTGWQHVWADLSPYAGQTLSLTVALNQAVGAAWVDEISLGPNYALRVDEISPTTWWVKTPVTLTITGENFAPTATVQLGATTLLPVLWINTTQIQVAVPGNLPAGDHVLTITNYPGYTYTTSVDIRDWRIYLPCAMRNFNTTTQISSREPFVDTSQTAGWSTWGYDVAHTGYNRYDPGGSFYTLAWTADLAMPAHQVSVVDGVVVASGAPGYVSVLALDAETGTQLWKRDFYSPNGLGAPSIANGQVYFQHSNHSNSALYCVGLYDGVTRWKAPFSVQWESFLAPLIVKNRAYIKGGYYGGMYGFNAVDGRYLWYQYLPQESSFSVWIPSFANNVLYTHAYDKLRAHSVDTGEVLWEYNPRYYNTHTPVISNNRLYLYDSEQNLQAYDVNQRKVVWTAQGATPTTDGQVAYAVYQGIMKAYAAEDGTLLWQYTGIEGADFPIIAGNYLYVATDSQTYILDRTTHELVWETDLGGHLTVGNGFLYIARSDNTLYAYRAEEP